MDIEAIYLFLEEVQGVKRSKLSPSSDFLNDLGIDGDDFSELMESFAEKYEVDMSSYRWYFHHGEEGWNMGAIFFKPPYEQVETISVKPLTLLEAAQQKMWPICYPPHELRKGRPDITLNIVFLLIAGVLGVSLWLSNKFSA